MNLFSAWLFCVTAGPTLVQNLPSAVQTLCESWNNIHTNEFPNIGSWVSAASGPAVVWVQPQGLLAVGAVVALCHIQGCDVCVCVCPSPAQRLCQRHHPCRELHQRRAGCPPGHPLQPEPAPGSLPQAHPAVPGQAHRGSHCVSSCVPPTAGCCALCPLGLTLGCVCPPLTDLVLLLT